ncbi:helix-turn-helix domain-containing protein [Kitasatospora sp. NPDC001175]|uniref:helix-turn-helix domain-containing protein n=1 Tax=Kitasatospora sp. NPDC001175 TaxID=3157103 RepID=UPI003D071492
MSTTTSSAVAEWLTAKEAAEVMGCSPQTVYKKAGAGLLPGAKAVGNGKVRRTGFRVPRSVVEEYLASSEFGPTAA